jgi:signal transduction histidine kinase
MPDRFAQQWSKSSLTVLGLSFLIVLLFSIGCIFTYEKLRDERRNEYRADAQRMLLAFEEHSTRLFDYADGQLRAIRTYVNEHGATENGNTEKLANFIHEIRAPQADTFSGVVALIDRDGRIVYHSHAQRDKISVLGNVRDLDHYQYFLAHPGDSLFVGATRRGLITGKMQYRLARPLFKNGVFDGLVMMSLLPDYITDFYRSTSLGKHSTAIMFTQGRLIARQPAVPGMYDVLLPYLDEKYSDSATPPKASPFDQIRRDVFYKRFSHYPVTLLIGIAEQDRNDTLAGVRQKLIGLALVFALFSMLVCTLILSLLSKNRRLALAENASSQSLSELHRLSDAIETTKEYERKRIAQDIHDELGQNLLVLKMDVAVLHARTGGAHPKLNQRTSLVLSNINAAIHSVKSIMNNLRPVALELGLIAAVEWQLKQFMRSSGIECNLVATNETELGLDDKSTTAVFRIFQEALSNVVRHAQATKVEVTLHRYERGFSMLIKDNGKGIGPGEREKANSFGLMGIKERAHALDAEFTIDSTENGTTLSIFIAMQARDTGRVGNTRSKVG